MQMYGACDMGMLIAWPLLEEQNRALWWTIKVVKGSKNVLKIFFSKIFVLLLFLMFLYEV